MKLLKRSDRIKLYLLVSLSLYFFSQIVINTFASHHNFAYIVATLNGVIAIEVFFFISKLRADLAIKLYWLVFFVRLILILVIIMVYAYYLKKYARFEFVGYFFAIYFIWVSIEIYILQKFQTKEKRYF
jgi:hypothetical protein